MEFFKLKCQYLLQKESVVILLNEKQVMNSPQTSDVNRPDSPTRREFEFGVKRLVCDERWTVTGKIILQDRCVTYEHARRKYNKQSLHNIQSMCNLPSLHGQRVLVCRVGFNGNGNGAQRQKIACLEVNLIYLKAAVIGFFHEQGGFSNQIKLIYTTHMSKWLRRGYF